MIMPLSVTPSTSINSKEPPIWLPLTANSVAEHGANPVFSLRYVIHHKPPGKRAATMAATGAMMRAKMYSAGMAPAFLPPIPHSGATDEVVTQWCNLTLAS